MSKRTTIALLAGDGIGPEITDATRQVLSRADNTFDLGLEYRDIAVGFASLARDGSTFTEHAYEAAKACDGIVLGPVSHSEYPLREQGGLNPSGELRKRLDLYANIRPARTRPSIPPCGGREFDIVIYRENTEGFYSDRAMVVGTGEIMPTDDLAMSFRKVTRKASLRIAEAAFAGAEARRKKVTAVHKANVFRVSDGLFLECVRQVAADHSDVEYDEILVDAMCAHLVRNPARYDVICTTNMFGDILSDLASELAGGLGLAASLNAGTDYAMAQAQHGSAPDIAGRNIANPSSLIGSAAMLLKWIGKKQDSIPLQRAGAAIGNALEAVLSEPDLWTPDLGGSSTTNAFGKAVADRIFA